MRGYWTLIILLTVSTITRANEPPAESESAKPIELIQPQILDGSLPVEAASEEVDSSFEEASAGSREDKVYITRAGDSLSRVGYLLTGDRNGFREIVARADNGHLKKFGVRERLPEGTKVNYEGPVIGETYVVRKGDWLIRIAEWKYGSYEEWERVYQANQAAIAGPDLIFPGDTLFFGADGSISKNGKDLVKGVVKPMIRRIPSGKVDQNLSAAEPFRVGFMTGVALLGVLPLLLYWARRRQMSLMLDSIQIRPEKPRHEPTAVSHEEIKVETEPDHEIRGWPFRFKWRKLDEMTLPTDRLRQGRASSPFLSGYHRIKKFRDRER